MRTKIILLIFLCLYLSCCIFKCNCDNEMEDIRNQYGKPEEVESYSSSEYQSETWWYWSKGISYTFTWGSSVKGHCELSKYTFTPIPLDSSKEEKSKTKNFMRLVEREINFCNK